MLVENFWTKEEATAATLFALFDGYRISDVAIENISSRWQPRENEFLNGNYVGCIFLRESNAIFKFETSPRATSTGMGSVGRFATMFASRIVTVTITPAMAYIPARARREPCGEQPKLERNEIGFFFCWGVKWGLVRGEYDASTTGSSESRSATTTRTIWSETTKFCAAARSDALPAGARRRLFAKS